MKKKIKRLDKKETSNKETTKMKCAEDSPEEPTGDSVYFIKESKKNRSVVVIETIGFILVAIIAFGGLLSSVLAAEGFFGNPDEWTWRDSRVMWQLALGICAGILYLVTELKKKIINRIVNRKMNKKR